METVKDKLLKIKALADKGYAGEARNAKLLLDKMLDKYNLTLDDLMCVELKKRGFKVPFNKMVLFFHIVYSVIGKRANNIVYYGNKKTEQFVKLTDLEYIEIESMINFHFKQFDKELKKQHKAIISAYIIKQSLAVSNDVMDEDDRPKMSMEEMLAIRNAINGLDDVYYRKQIKG